MKQHLLIFLLLSTSFLALSQNRTELWTKLTVTKTFSPKWSVAADIQYRSQSNYRASKTTNNLFEHNLAHTFRLSVFYKLPKDWTLISSPFIYFFTTDIDKQSNLFSSREFRTAWGVSKNFQLATIKTKNRFLYETRFFEWNKPNAYFHQRFRLQNTFLLPFCKRNEKPVLQMCLMNEFFLRIQQKQTSFEQNRILGGIIYQYKWAEIMSGYMHVFQKGSTASFQRKIWLLTLNLNL